MRHPSNYNTSPALKYPRRSVTFAATALGDVSSASINATNTTKKPLTFQVYAPADSGLFVNPVVATLPPGGVQLASAHVLPRALDFVVLLLSPETVRLQIDYTPRQDAAAQQHYALCGAVSQGSASTDTPSYPLPPQDVPLLVSESFSIVPPPPPEAAEPFSFHRNWRLPVFVQGEQSSAPIFIGVCLTAVRTPFLPPPPPIYKPLSALN